MEIKALAMQIEKLINEKMETFTNHGKKSSELSKKIMKLQEEQFALHKKMADILSDLEPVESIVRAQNPTMNDLFDKLKTAYLTNDVPAEEIKSELVL